jgi:hypothetical protein
MVLLLGLLMALSAPPVGASPPGQAPDMFLRGPVATPAAGRLSGYSTVFFLGLTNLHPAREGADLAAAPSVDRLNQDDVVLYDTFEGEALQGWEVTSGIELMSPGRVDDQCVRLVNANMHRTIDTTPGQRYKMIAWVKIAQEVGDDWGGFRLEAQSRDWSSLAHSGWLLRSTHGSEWFKVAMTFTASTSQTRVHVGYFGGPNRQMLAQVDEVIIFRPGEENLPPEVGISLDPVALSGLPQLQRYAMVGDDPDGAITRVVWDFGDGTRAFGASGVRRITSPGRYEATVQVTDDDGAVVSQTIPWAALDPARPGLAITRPSEAGVFSAKEAVLQISGTAGSDVARVMVSTDRGLAIEATGSRRWQAEVLLEPGLNRVLVQAQQANGGIITQERLVRYVPGGELTVAELRESQAEVERWAMQEITFAIRNSAATHPQLPYEAEPGRGLETLDGITVEGLFSRDGWQTVYRRPGYMHQEYDRRLVRGEEWLYPVDEPVWTVRFAPPEEGEWVYRIEVQEAKGSATSEERQFVAVEPANELNRGPLRVSPTDSRYFEYADGTTFLGTGHGTGFSPERFSYDAREHLQAMGTGNQELLRWWIGGMIWGSAWQPWNSRTLDFDGYLPATGLTLERAYGDSLASLRLDTSNPIMFQGWGTGHVGLRPGQLYRLRVRWRTEGIKGPAVLGQAYGVTLKFVDWPTPGQTGSVEALIPHVSLDTPWHVAETTFVAQNDYLPNLALILENATAGAAYVDEVGLYEVRPDGSQGPQLMRQPRFGCHICFEPRRAAGIDVVLAEAEAQGIYFKLVISEKNDYLLNRLAPEGLPDPNGGHFDSGEGAAVRALHRAYWRYLFARYGAYRSVHSWELVNEGDPNSLALFDLAAALAREAAADGNPKMASTSTWATLAVSSWQNPVSEPLSYVDFHTSVRYSGWIEPKEQLLNDSARFFAEYDREAAAAGLGKPVVWGEQAIDSTQSPDVQEPLLAQDQEGVWLHKITWARSGPGGVYPLYWYTEHIMDKGLHGIYGAWNRFMRDIPLSNGGYRDARATTSDPHLRVFGQKDVENGRAHLWVDNSRHTWRAVVDGATISAVSSTITMDMDRPTTPYRVIWHDTSTGEPKSEQVLSSDEAGVLVLSVQSLADDIAVKIEPVE